MDTPIIIADPLPRRLDTIMEPSVRRRLEALGKVVLSEDRSMPDEEVDRLLPRASLLFGQTALPRERLHGRHRRLFPVMSAGGRAPSSSTMVGTTSNADRTPRSPGSRPGAMT